MVKVRVVVGLLRSVACEMLPCASRILFLRSCKSMIFIARQHRDLSSGEDVFVHISPAHLTASNILHGLIFLALRASLGAIAYYFSAWHILQSVFDNPFEFGVSDIA